MNRSLWLVISVVFIGATVAAPFVLLGLLGLGHGDTARLQIVLSFVGGLVATSVAAIGHLTSYLAERRLRQQAADQRQQLKLDAAMRAGSLISPADSMNPHPAAVASGLLALTDLDRADLAVALLVDLWSDREGAVSTETAILVIDAALRSTSASARLVAAELLCRNATRLDPCQSLHWPSAVEGRWIPSASRRTKLLTIEALVFMTLNGPATESALRSIAARLYGIWENEPTPHARGCIGKLIGALTERLDALPYKEFMQGNTTVMLDQLHIAAESAEANPDDYLDHLSTELAQQLKHWSMSCEGDHEGRGLLATAEHGPNDVPSSARPLTRLKRRPA